MSLRRAICVLRGHHREDPELYFRTYPRCTCGAWYDWLAGRWSKDPQQPLAHSD